MLVRAPGKLFLTGAFAVLEGAEAIILAVDRYAVATIGSTDPSPRPEVQALSAALGVAAPLVDTSALEDAGRKLGLGSSAAGVVAAAGAILCARGVDLATEAGRWLVLEAALSAHQSVQPRGSGGDVAAATFGAVVRVRRIEHRVDVLPAALPFGLSLETYAIHRSARTSDALDRLAERRGGRAVEAAMRALMEAASLGSDAVVRGAVPAFVDATRAHVTALRALARALDLALVPEEIDAVHPVLQDVVLLPSGAGGGDVVVRVAARPPDDDEEATLARAGLHHVPLHVATTGVHVASGTP